MGFLVILLRVICVSKIFLSFSGERDVYFAPDNPDVVLSIPPSEGVITIWDVNYHDRLRRIRTEGIFPSAFHYISEKHIALWDYNTRKIFLIDYVTEKLDGVINGKIGDIPPTTAYSNTWQYLHGFEFLVVSEDSKSINRWDIKSGELLNSINTFDQFGIATFLVRAPSSYYLLIYLIVFRFNEFSFEV